MRCWIVTIGEPLPEEGGRLLRSGLLARCLDDAGHAVLWWNSRFDHARKRQRDGARLRAVGRRSALCLLRASGYRRNVSVARLVDHHRLAADFRRRAPSFRSPDLILASMPTPALAIAAVAYGHRYGVRVVIDVRDLWPDAVADLAPPPLRWPARLCSWLLRRRLARALRAADALFAVSEDYLDWACRLAGRDRSRWDAALPLSAPTIETGEAARAQAAQRLAPILQAAEGRLLCWFVGSFGRSYDLLTVVDAARMLDRRAAGRCLIVLSGDGEAMPALRRAATGVDSLRLTGWVDAAAIDVLRRRADLGLAAYAAAAPQSMPNKIYDYLSASLPIVHSLGGETRRVLQREGCGCHYPPGDAAALAGALGALGDDRRRLAAMARAAATCYRQDYAPERVYPAFRRRLEAIARSGAR